MRTWRARGGSSVAVVAALVVVLSGCSGQPGVASSTSSSSTSSAAPSSAEVVRFNNSTEARHLATDSGALSAITNVLGNPGVAIADHAVVVGTADGDALDEAALRASSGVDQARRMAGSRDSGKVLVVLAPTQAAYTGMGVADGASPGESGQTVQIPGRSPWVLIDAAQPVDTSDGRLPLSKVDQLMLYVLQHETFHAVTLNRAAATKLPLWVVEGYADLAGYQGVTIGHPPVGRTSLPTDAEMKGKDAGGAYYRAYQFVAYLNERFGESKVMALYGDLMKHPAPARLENIVRRHLGQGLDQLVKAWSAASKASANG